MLIGRKTLGTVAYMGGVMSLPSPFVHAWQQMQEYNAEYLIQQTERINYIRATVSYHSFARNMLVEHMQGDFLLQLDTDIVFEPDLLARMLKKMNQWDIGVLVAPYLYKAEPYPPVLYGWDSKKKEKFMLDYWQSKKEVDLIPIWGAGAGCLLVKRWVFDKIRAKTGQSPFDIYVDKAGSPLSEDHSFFQRCFDAKIPCYAHPDLFVKHLIYKGLDVEKDYNPNLNLLSKTKKIKSFWKPLIHLTEK